MTQKYFVRSPADRLRGVGFVVIIGRVRARHVKFTGTSAFTRAFSTTAIPPGNPGHEGKVYLPTEASSQCLKPNDFARQNVGQVYLRPQRF